MMIKTKIIKNTDTKYLNSMTKDEVLQCTALIPSNAYRNATIYIEGLLRMSSHLLFVKLETKVQQLQSLA